MEFHCQMKITGGKKKSNKANVISDHDVPVIIQNLLSNKV